MYIAMKIRLKLLLASFLLNTILHAQINTLFVKYLSDLDLVNEQFTYLNSFAPHTDSLNYHWFNFHLKNKNIAQLLELNAPENIQIRSNKELINKASIEILTGRSVIKQNWFNSVKMSDSLFQEIRLAYLVSERSAQPNGSGLYTTSRYKKYNRSVRKKPLIGGLCSMVVPGLGKWYAGKPKSFLTTLLLNASYGLSSYESINKLGIKNGYSIATLSIAGLFYVANVYGGYKATKDAKKEHKHQFLLDAQNYYNFNYTFY